MPVFSGTDGSDNLVGGSDDDVLNGAGGDDALDGRGGRDELHGGEGDDFLGIRDPVVAGEVFDGGAGHDTLYVSASVHVPLSLPDD